MLNLENLNEEGYEVDGKEKVQIEERLWVELTFFENGALRVEINDFDLSRFRVAKDLQSDVVLEVEKLARLPDLEKIVQISENKI